jgi:hypothetical protein
MARNRFSAPEPNARSGAQQTVIDGPFAETKELIAGSFWPDPGEVERREGRVGQRSPNQMEDESEVEIRQVFEADDFDSEFTPELSEQEERVGGG